jgi:hypothetical protein
VCLPHCFTASFPPCTKALRSCELRRAPPILWLSCLTHQGNVIHHSAPSTLPLHCCGEDQLLLEHIPSIASHTTPVLSLSIHQPVTSSTSSIVAWPCSFPLTATCSHHIKSQPRLSAGSYLICSCSFIVLYRCRHRGEAISWQVMIHQHPILRGFSMLQIASSLKPSG